jgi:hypothetical protein
VRVWVQYGDHEDSVFWYVMLSSPVVISISDEPRASLKMKAEDSSNTMATIYHTTWHHISKDNDLNNALVVLELSDL